MLDIHLADTFDSATRTERIVGISLEVHTAFFGERSLLAADCPLLLRMSSYFSDCEYSNSEIQVLMAEIGKVRTRIDGNSPHDSWLGKIQEACKEAIKSGHSLFVLCD